jgi:hypothetical protein
MHNHVRSKLRECRSRPAGVEAHIALITLAESPGNPAVCRLGSPLPFVMERNLSVDVRRYLHVLLGRKVIVIVAADVALLVVLAVAVLAARANPAFALPHSSEQAKVQDSARSVPNHQTRFHATMQIQINGTLPGRQC